MLRWFEERTSNNVIGLEALIDIELKIGDHDEEDHEHEEQDDLTR